MDAKSKGEVDGAGGVRPVYGPVLRALYEAVLISDLEGRIVDANPRAERTFGCRRSDLEGREISSVIAGFGPEIMAGVARNLAEGRFTVLDAYCRRENGATFPAETAISRLQLDGRELLVFSVRNMEWRERTLERLRTGYNALHNAAAGLVITDGVALIVYANPAFGRLWGNESEADSWIGRDIRDLWVDPAQAKEMAAAAGEGRIWIGELEGHRRDDGQAFFVQATAAPNRTVAEAQAGLVFSFIDVTERKRAEEAIRKEAEAQIRKAREQDEFSGLLNILSITDIVQLVEASQKSGWLVILDADMKEHAQIGFVAGQVVAAECGQRAGQEAFFEMLRVGGHAFLFRQGVPEEQDTQIGLSTMGLLLEGSRRMDESSGRVVGGADRSGVGSDA